VLAGAILLGEPLPTSPSTAVPAVLAAALTIAGTITLGRLAPDHHAKPAAAAEAVQAPVPLELPVAAPVVGQTSVTVQPQPVDASSAPRPSTATSDLG
jgi:hypothetical protein